MDFRKKRGHPVNTLLLLQFQQTTECMLLLLYFKGSIHSVVQKFASSENSIKKAMQNLCSFHLRYFAVSNNAEVGSLKEGS